MASKTQEKSIDIVRKAWYNINGEHRWRLLPLSDYLEITALCEKSGGYFFIYLGDY